MHTTTRYTILVPVFMPDGDTPVPAEILEWTRRQLSARFGGATVDPPSEGSWVDGDGVTITEPMRPVWTVAAPGVTPDSEVQRIAENVAYECEQEAVLVLAETVRVAFVAPTTSQPREAP